MPLRAVVFDVGNVLYDWDPRYLYEKLIDDPARLDWFLANVVTHAWHFQHDAGRPVAQTSAELTARFPAEAALIAAYAPRWLETIAGPVAGMPELVAELAARGVPLYAITNFSAEFWPRFRAVTPLFDAFAGILVSGEEGLTKPDPRIYELAIARWRLTPDTCLFVDDRADNVAAAQAAGMQGRVFDGAAALRALLRRESLLL